MSYTLSNPPSSGMSGAIYTACRVAHKYRDRTPSLKNLIDDFGMSKPTAYRWLAAIRAAKGETNEQGK